MRVERQGHGARLRHRWGLWGLVSASRHDRVYLKLTQVHRSNRQSSLSPLTPFIPLPKYFESEWSYAQYRVPTQSAHISLSSTSIRTPGRDPDVADEERCVVGWIETPSERAGASVRTEYQLIALTWTGGWYRLSLPSSSAAPATPSTPVPSTPRVPLSPLSGSPPSVQSLAAQHHRPRSSSGSIFSGRSDKGKERERDKDKEGSQCVLQEFRRYGRWDGWG